MLLNAPLLSNLQERRDDGVWRRTPACVDLCQREFASNVCQEASFNINGVRATNVLCKYLERMTAHLQHIQMQMLHNI